MLTSKRILHSSISSALSISHIMSSKFLDWIQFWAHTTRNRNNCDAVDHLSPVKGASLLITFRRRTQWYVAKSEEQDVTESLKIKFNAFTFRDAQEPNVAESLKLKLIHLLSATHKYQMSRKVNILNLIYSLFTTHNIKTSHKF